MARPFPKGRFLLIYIKWFYISSLIVYLKFFLPARSQNGNRTTANVGTITILIRVSVAKSWFSDVCVFMIYVSPDRNVFKLKVWNFWGKVYQIISLKISDLRFIPVPYSRVWICINKILVWKPPNVTIVLTFILTITLSCLWTNRVLYTGPS